MKSGFSLPPTSGDVTPAPPSATRDPARWTWPLVASLMTAGLSGVPLAREGALALVALQTGSHAIRFRSLRHFPTQVRAVYLTWMALSFLPGLELLFWVQLAGTWLLSLTGYCLLARTLMVLPVNRAEPLSTDFIRRVFLMPPTSGSIRDRINKEAKAA